MAMEASKTTSSLDGRCDYTLDQKTRVNFQEYMVGSDTPRGGCVGPGKNICRWLFALELIIKGIQRSDKKQCLQFITDLSEVVHRTEKIYQSVVGGSCKDPPTTERDKISRLRGEILKKVNAWQAQACDLLKRVIVEKTRARENSTDILCEVLTRPLFGKRGGFKYELRDDGLPTVLIEKEVDEDFSIGSCLLETFEETTILEQRLKTFSQTVTLNQRPVQRGCNDPAFFSNIEPQRRDTIQKEPGAQEHEQEGIKRAKTYRQRSNSNNNKSSPRASRHFQSEPRQSTYENPPLQDLALDSMCSSPDTPDKDYPPPLTPTGERYIERPPERSSSSPPEEEFYAARPAQSGTSQRSEHYSQGGGTEREIPKARPVREELPSKGGRNSDRAKARRRSDKSRSRTRERKTTRSPAGNRLRTARSGGRSSQQARTSGGNDQSGSYSRRSPRERRDSSYREGERGGVLKQQSWEEGRSRDSGGRSGRSRSRARSRKHTQSPARNQSRAARSGKNTSVQASVPNGNNQSRARSNSRSRSRHESLGYEEYDNVTGRTDKNRTRLDDDRNKTPVKEKGNIRSQSRPRNDTDYRNSPTRKTTEGQNLPRCLREDGDSDTSYDLEYMQRGENKREANMGYSSHDNESLDDVPRVDGQSSQSGKSKSRVNPLARASTSNRGASSSCKLKTGDRTRKLKTGIYRDSKDTYRKEYSTSCNYPPVPDAPDAVERAQDLKTKHGTSSKNNLDTGDRTGKPKKRVYRDSKGTKREKGSTSFNHPPMPKASHAIKTAKASKSKHGTSSRSDPDTENMIGNLKDRLSRVIEDPYGNQSWNPPSPFMPETPAARIHNTSGYGPGPYMPVPYPGNFQDFGSMPHCYEPGVHGYPHNGYPHNGNGHK